METLANVVAIVLAFAIVFGIGYWVGDYRSKHRHQKIIRNRTGNDLRTIYHDETNKREYENSFGDKFDVDLPAGRGILYLEDANQPRRVRPLGY